MTAPITGSARAGGQLCRTSPIGRDEPAPVNRHGSSRHCIELRSRSPRIPRSSVEVLVWPPASANRFGARAASTSTPASVVQPTSRRPSIAVGNRDGHPRQTSRARSRHRCRACRPRHADDPSRHRKDPTVGENVLSSALVASDGLTVFSREPAIQARAPVMACAGLHHAHSIDRSTWCRARGWGGVAVVAAVRGVGAQRRREETRARSVCRSPSATNSNLRRLAG